jgi:DNA invertase Pin-like site-specific DNA recombinase
MNPLIIFGDMRVPVDMSNEEAKQKQDELNTYAENNGFQLMTVFHGYDSGGQSAFAELGEGVQHAEAKHVVVSSYRESALNTSRQDAMLTPHSHLSHATGAESMNLDECS